MTLDEAIKHCEDMEKNEGISMDIKELIKKREEINREIAKCRKEQREKAKKDKGIFVCGKAKLSFDGFSRGKEWYIAYKMVNKNYKSEEKWRSIFRSCDRNEVIAEIDNIIKDLEDLKELAGGKS